MLHANDEVMGKQSEYDKRQRLAEAYWQQGIRARQTDSDQTKLTASSPGWLPETSVRWICNGGGGGVYGHVISNSMLLPHSRVYFFYLPARVGKLRDT